ncbi:RHS repeat domain-containing protein [Bdellovibrio sp. HCB117]|uniref:RHS repeat domain-containing protein n=1 Tax=Bdellovibrio sp. HCB117 TaxID=3394359 RepID=UPI0039B4A86B
MFALTIALLALSITNFAKAATCEENKQQALATARAECSGSGCYPNSFCYSYLGLFFERIPNSPTNAYSVTCKVKFLYPNQPEFISSTPEGSVDDCISNSQVHVKKTSHSQMNSKKVCGSIVGVEDQTLGETISLVGASFSLQYSTALSRGRTGDYTIEAEVVGALPRDYLTSFTYEVFDGTTTILSQTFLNTPNQNFTFVWNGLDLSSNPVFGPRKFKVDRTETSPVGSFTYPEEFYLGSFDASKIGLGGWLPSNFHLYSYATNKLYSSDGSVRHVVAQPLGGLHYVADLSGDLVYFFDSTGRQVSTKSGFLGYTVYSFNYDVQGRLISIAEPFGKTTYFNRDLFGNLTDIAAPNGKITTVGLDSNGFISSVTNPNSETYTLTNSTEGLLLSFQKPMGQVSTFSYDSKGNLIRDEHSGGYFFELVRSLTPSYPTDINLVSRMGRVTRAYGSGDAKTVKRTVNYSVGGSEEYQYSSNGTTAEETIVDRGVRTYSSYSVDSRFGGTANRLSYVEQRTQNSATKRVDNTYNISLSNPSDPFSISNYSVTQFFDSQYFSQVTTVFDPANKRFTATSMSGNTSIVDIDAYERPILLKNGNEDSISLSYTNENLTSVTQGSRNTELGYNSDGYISTITNALNQATGFIYDSAGRITSKVLSDSRVIGFTYDSNGRLASITPPGRSAHFFAVNASELPYTYNPPSLSGVTNVQTAYAYNNDKQLTQILKPSGVVIDVNYNSTNGRLQSYVTSEGTYSISVDSTSGLPSSVSVPGGQNVSISYNGKIPSSVWSNDTIGGSYLSLGYIPTFTTGNLIYSDEIYQGGSLGVVNYTFNADRKLESAGQLSLSYSSPNGRLSGTVIGNSPNNIGDTFSYNSFGELTGYDAKYGTNSILAYTLNRDALGRVASRTETVGGVTDTFEYTYDDVGRLTEVKKNSIIQSTYGYDTNNNRVSGNVGSQTITASYDAQDRITSYNVFTYVHNTNGEMISKTNTLTGETTTFTYDSFGNTKTVTLPNSDVISYYYDGLFRRVAKKVNSTLIKRWVYMDQLRVAAELDGAGNLQKRFVYASKSNVPDYMVMSGSSYRIVSDSLGSPRLVVKVSDGSVLQKVTYDEFGRVLSDTNSGAIPFKFAGGLYDEDTHLIRFGARDYDPSIGRWLSKDPILFLAGDSNVFGYVAQDPVNSIDPSGLYEICTTPLGGFSSEFGPVYHQYLCANGVCGGQTRSGNAISSAGVDSNDPAPGSTGVKCKEGPKHRQGCMDQCVADAIGGSRPQYSVINVGGANCQKWVSDTVERCSAQCNRN